MNMKLLAFLTLTLLALAACEQGLIGLTDKNETGDISELFDDVDIDETVDSGDDTSDLEPAIEESSRFIVTKTEGDLVILAPEAVDPDGDVVTYSFTTPFDSKGKWQTELGDAGEYTVTVTATDTKGASATENVYVVIEHANRAPYLKCPEKVVVKEGEIVFINCEANDLENGVTLSFFGWMTSDGYETGYADSGEHEVLVQATDNVGLSVEQTVKVIVQNVNRPPVFPIDFPSIIAAQEGDIIPIDTSEIYDPDGDTVTVTFSTPFGQDGLWRTDIGDGGEYSVDVVASDGKSTTKETVLVKIGLLNTAPVLSRIPDITVFEGETIYIRPEATDREGNALSYAYSGWMTSSAYETTYEDAGVYSTKVTASDGQHSDSQVIHITVIDRNRPPAFIVPG
ncbi:hypothetical protein GOV07_01040 [Candidatus Woesearchaeota archaeon]|nr:hypothetical protein [Candidatus Woesearchaeota archaeon]